LAVVRGVAEAVPLGERRRRRGAGEQGSLELLSVQRAQSTGEGRGRRPVHRRLAVQRGQLQAGCPQGPRRAQESLPAATAAAATERIGPLKPVYPFPEVEMRQLISAPGYLAQSLCLRQK